MGGLPEKPVLYQKTVLPETCALSTGEKSLTSRNISKELTFQNRVPRVRLLIFWLVLIFSTYITPTKTSKDFQETQLQDIQPWVGLVSELRTARSETVYRQTLSMPIWFTGKQS